MTAHRGAQVRRVVDTFRRDGRVEVRFSRSMVGVYLVLGVGLLAAGLALIGMVLGVVSPGTGTVEGGDAVMGSVFALVGLFILGLGIGQARPSGPPVVADAEGVHVQGKCVPWSVISGFGTSLQGNRLDKSHLVATILVDESTVDAWVAQRRSAGGRRSRLYAPGIIGSEGICLPYNLAVNAEPLSKALETIRADVTTRA
ncbi:hypothetical protein GCM10009817_14590 [Terrabacter lapilli]|uniref:Uncharacterized protein n=1 Tax=Terrabacter lapilli TaxID=436231 RepID=A0ABP5D7R6_9MICO|nr:hypothetical protein [Terrabacter sp.]